MKKNYSNRRPDHVTLTWLLSDQVTKLVTSLDFLTPDKMLLNLKNAVCCFTAMED